MIREWTHRLLGALRRGRSDDDLAEELRLHVELAGGAGKRTRGAAHAMDALRDQRGWPWVDALASDIVFGWRQLRKHRVVSLVAILSLGLAMGATTAAFRLVDAVLLRPLPVADPERLYCLATTYTDSEKRTETRDDVDYPTFRRYTATVGGRAQLMVVGSTSPVEITFGGIDEVEMASQQFVSGNVFPTFALRPVLGRLLAPGDDVTPGGHPVAVVSFDFWSRRLARDPSAVGKTFRMGRHRYEIVGVAPKGFTGTEPGFVTDLFIPSMMNVEALDNPGWSWFRLWVRPNEGTSPEQIERILPAAPGERLSLLPAGSGVSGVQKEFRRPLFILAALATLVLLVACANVANVLTAQALSRAREMALRVSIGAGRGRLIQLVLVESGLLALAASILGTLIAAWSAPMIVAMLAPPRRPLRLVLDADWRALALGGALTAAVTVLFGLAPALRASLVKPVGALKGGEGPMAHRRLTHGLVAAQMAFCVFVVFVAGLFVVTLNRLSNRPLGFAPDRLLVMRVETGGRAHGAEIWAQIAAHLRQIPGVESAAIAGWAPLSGNRWRAAIEVPGRQAAARPNALSVAPAYFATMGISLVDGRDFRRDDVPPALDAAKLPIPGVGIVNETFVRAFFDGRSPIGAVVRMIQYPKTAAPMEIVGVVSDAMYSNVREPIPPTVYVPFAGNGNATVMVRTVGDPLALAAQLRREVTRAQPQFRARGFETQATLVRQQLLRERLLATLSLVFAGIALLLGAIGLYGVLNYAVVRRRREIGIRMALGARATHVVRGVTAEIVLLVSVGAAIGLGGGLAFGRVVDALLFQVRPTDPANLAAPLLILGAVATMAVVPPAIRAVRIDPAHALRTE